MSATVPALNSDHPVVVIGAGPVGLAAAAHLLARGLTPLVLEAGSAVASNIRDWGHVRLFSPWRYNIDGVAAALLARTGWHPPDLEALPTGAELLTQYLEPLATVPEIAATLRFGHRVSAITRQGVDKVKSAGRGDHPFLVRVQTEAGEQEIVAAAILDASGTWGTPNPLGSNGLPALGEAAHADRIAYGIPDVLGRARADHAGRHVLVVGAGHSAANALLDLATLAESEPGTRITWAVRGGESVRAFGGGDADMLQARGALGSALRGLARSGRLEQVTGFGVRAVRAEAGSLTVESVDGRRIEGVDRIIVATGQRPDLAPTRELRLGLDPWLESTAALGPLIDPNLHSCGTVRPHGARELAHPEPGFYTVGIKSYGRAPTFLLATGYEQVRSVAAFLAGDIAAAEEVRLELPETGVCNTRRGPDPLKQAVSDCCGGPAPAGVDACCVQDAEIKATGGSGCGSAASGKAGSSGCGKPDRSEPHTAPAAARCTVAA